MDKRLVPVFFLLLVLDVFVWKYIFSGDAGDLEIHFLDVGQGDSILLVLPGRAKVLIDGGPDMAAVKQLDKLLPFFDRDIDLVILSHAQQDHFSGLIDVVQRYRIGAFLSNGLRAESERYEFFEKVLEKNNVYSLSLREGDAIRYGDYEFEVLAPSSDFRGADLNESSLVLKFISPDITSLFAADIGFSQEKSLVAKYDVRADILKAAHHGSKYSSGEAFLKAVSPRLAVFEAGENNRFGHPSSEVLARMEKRNIRIFRTDQDGTISVISDKKGARIVKDKPR